MSPSHASFLSKSTLIAARACGVAFALVLTACQNLPPAAPNASPPSTDRAGQQEQAGQYLLAAQEYDRLAQTSSPPQRQDYQLKAVAILLGAGQIAEARARMPAINLVGLPAEFTARKQILQAQLAIAENRSDQALRILNQAEKTRSLDPKLYSEMYRVRAQAEAALGNILNAARDYVVREKFIVNDTELKENQKQLWAYLSGQDPATLAKTRALTRDPIVADWMDLALIVLEKPAGSPQLGIALEDWRNTHPQHPALQSVFPTLASSAPMLIGAVNKIAVLLPLTSDYQSAAQAVSDGVAAMQRASKSSIKPEVKVFDIGADPLQAPAMYAAAVADGAQFIIGPLGLDAAEAVAKNSTFTVPTMLLSHVEGLKGRTLAVPVFQFGLPPEQEAVQVAERAYIDGAKRAAVLLPNNNWGQRMLNAFSTQWQQLGGTVVATQTYATGGADYSDTIKQLLRINTSEARHKALESTLRTKLKFESRPREDVDMIFLAADAKHARLIKPQLSYFRASQVPVYAASNVFSGKPDPISDTDLDGIIFGDMPWMLLSNDKMQALRGELQGESPIAHTSLDRLFALGVDAYALIPQLNRLNADPNLRFNGLTSGLRLDGDKRLQRQLLWARFRRGQPQVIDSFLEQYSFGALPSPAPNAKANSKAPGQ